MKTLALMSLFVLTSLNALAAPKTVTLEVPTMNCVTCPFTAGQDHEHLVRTLA